MNRVSRIGLLAIGVLLGLVFALGSPPAAGTQAQTEPQNGLPSSAPGGVARDTLAPSEPQAGGVETYVRLAGSVLKPRDSDAEWASGADGGCVYVSSGNSQVVFNAPLTLPQGSTVTRLRMYVNDTSVANCIGWFTAYDRMGYIVDEWAVQSDTVAGETWWDVFIPNYVIDYGVYSYVVNWRPYDIGPGMQLCGFRIFYNPPGGLRYMPEVTRER